MSRSEYDKLFAAKPERPKTREEITDSTARAILKEEEDERTALTRKLREARLKMEARAPAPVPVKRKKPVTPRLIRY